MESELFGHKRGSFTGAVADKKGLVQSAEGGTLFLDEVADLPLHMQVKLLRVVQEKTVRPVGERARRSVDVRILSATHKNLAQLVAEGRFREDLFYRINVIEMRVPAARAQRGHSGAGRDDPARASAGGCSMEPPRLEPEAHAGAARATRFPATCASSRTCSSAPLTLCVGGVHHARTTSNCAPPSRAATRRSAATTAGRAAGGAGRSARGHRARRDREGTGEDALQQDRGREASRHELSGAALSDQEAGHRVDAHDALRHFVTRAAAERRVRGDVTKLKRLLALAEFLSPLSHLEPCQALGIAFALTVRGRPFCAAVSHQYFQEFF